MIFKHEKMTPRDATREKRDPKGEQKLEFTLKIFKWNKRWRPETPKVRTGTWGWAKVSPRAKQVVQRKPKGAKRIERKLKGSWRAMTASFWEKTIPEIISKQVPKALVFLPDGSQSGVKSKAKMYSKAIRALVSKRIRKSINNHIFWWVNLIKCVILSSKFLVSQGAGSNPTIKTKKPNQCQIPS